MNKLLNTSLALAGLLLAGQALAQVTFYENENFTGRSFTPMRQQVPNFADQGFNDRASSAIILNDRWEVCDDIGFNGHCIVLSPGRYRSLAAMGLNDRVSSVRSISRQAQIDEDRYAPVPDPVYDNRRRNHERLYDARVDSVRAVVGPPDRRCWVERQAVAAEPAGPNVTGAIAGALIGGVIGHQIGHGGGRDVATVGGAVGGAALGAQVGRGDVQPAGTRDIERCADNAGRQQTEFWDVSYRFRGIEHNIQMTSPPGATLTVNQRGEPRN